MMDQDDRHLNPFSSDGLWRLSRFTLQSLQPLEPLPWDEELPDLSGGFFKAPLDLFEGDQTKLHQLDIHGTNLFDRQQLLDETTDASSENHTNFSIDEQETQTSLEDIWSSDFLTAECSTQPPLKSWELYQDRSFCEPVSSYFSESGASAFDAALAQKAANHTQGQLRNVARNDNVFQSLFRLGLGWSSLLFRYNGQEETFDQIRGDIRVSGMSVSALNGIIEEILLCGNSMYRVRSFVDKTPKKSNDLSVISALSSAVTVIVYTLEAQAVQSSRHIKSLLQLKALFQPISELNGALAEIVGAVGAAVSEAQIISVVLEKAAGFSQRFGNLENVFREIVVRVCGPFIHQVGTWVGFRLGTSHLIDLATSASSFVKVEQPDDQISIAPSSKRGKIRYKYQPDQMPSFIPPDQAQQIFESGRGLRLLKQFHPQHPLTDDNFAFESPSFDCANTWKDVERIQKKAHEYERTLRSEIQRYNRGERPCYTTKRTSVSEDTQWSEQTNIVANTFELFEIDNWQRTNGSLPSQSSLEKDKLAQQLNGIKNPDHALLQDEENHFGPELSSSLYLSMAPLLSSQALLIDFSCLHLLFKEHKLRSHLDLQCRFQLLGDGFFLTRLSHALFDPEMSSGERKSGRVRNSVHTGLRLGSRDTWPPASSELRLVLIGLLDECHDAGSSASMPDEDEFRKERELPGGLSFSIRELPDEDIMKCKDPNRIEALDFLRLQYNPSVVLETILTQRSLNKYDQLFKHLLRLVRMNSVVKGLIRDSTVRGSLSGDTRNVFQKFRIDCQHFVLAVSDYCFHIGIGSIWQRFQDTLSRIELCINKNDIDGTIDAAHSVPRLRDYHEDILDQMLFALFLSKRHSDAAKLLEEIFGTILVFAPLSRLDGMRGVRHESEATVSRLYSTFRKQTSAFVGFLRNIDGVKASSKSFSKFGMGFGSRETPTSVFDHLLIRLDFKPYY